MTHIMTPTITVSFRSENYLVQTLHGNAVFLHIQRCHVSFYILLLDLKITFTSGTNKRILKIMQFDLVHGSESIFIPVDRVLLSNLAIQNCVIR